MKKHLGKIFLFLAGVVAGVVYFVRDLFQSKEEKHAAAVQDVEHKEADVAAAKADVAAAQSAAHQTHEAVDGLLAQIDQHLAEERGRDTVDVANDLIKGK